MLAQAGVGEVHAGAHDALELGMSGVVVALAVPERVVAVETCRLDHDLPAAIREKTLTMTLPGTTRTPVAPA